MSLLKKFVGLFVKEPVKSVEPVKVAPPVEVEEVLVAVEPEPIVPRAVSVYADGKWWIEVNGNFRLRPQMVRHTPKQIRYARKEICASLSVQHGLKR
ncbi:hypothetical protein VPHK397_0120 [Vibrio phage K397]